MPASAYRHRVNATPPTPPGAPHPRPPRTPRTPTPVARALTLATITIAAVAIALLAGEATLRLMPLEAARLRIRLEHLNHRIDVPSFGPAEFTSHGIRNRYNRHHMRAPEIDLDAPATQPRIAIIGDSVAAGLGVEEHHRFADLLANRLAKRGTPAQIINFGHPGLNAAQNYWRYDTLARRTRPDVTLFTFFWNDFGDFDGNPNPRRFCHDMPQAFIGEQLFGWLEDHTRIAALLGTAITAPRQNRDYFDPTLPGARCASHIVDLLARERDTTMRDTTMIAVLLPAFWGSEQSAGYIPDWFVETLTRAKLRTVDLRALVPRDEAARFGTFDWRDGHPNEAGHCLIAAALDALLFDSGINSAKAVTPGPPLTLAATTAAHLRATCAPPAHH